MDKPIAPEYREEMQSYRLEGRVPVPCTMEEMVAVFASDRTVDYDEITSGIRVSTVFLGIDHNHSRAGPAILFETMVFNDHDAIGEQQWRYSSWDEAQEGHDRACAELRARLVEIEVKGS